MRPRGPLRAVALGCLGAGAALACVQPPRASTEAPIDSNPIPRVD